MNANADVENAIAKADTIVLKRLKFILKIIKALTTSQPNSRNRQGYVYILEVLDAISDWSGNYDSELLDMLDKHMFPQVCRLIATFSKDEFNDFQQFFLKYVLVKWKETSNFIVLEFLSEIYGFIVSIAPVSVVDEYMEIFTKESMPPHVTFIILPSIIHNMKDNVAANFSDKITGIHRLPSATQISDRDLRKVVQFWNFVGCSLKSPSNIMHHCSLLYQCILSSDYLCRLTEIDIESIVDNIETSSNDDINVELFLLISVILLSVICCTCDHFTRTTLHTKLVGLLERVTVITGLLRHHSLRIFALKMLQKIMENSQQNLEFNETLKKVANVYNIENTLISDTKETNAEDTLQVLEANVKRILDESEHIGDYSENRRKRIKLVIESLQKIC